MTLSLASIALSLAATACGSGSGTEVDSAATTEATGATSQAAGDPGRSPSAEPTTPPSVAIPAADHSFPDLQTVNIVDGSTLNLADQLAGGDTPVLLWFWAPH